MLELRKHIDGSEDFDFQIAARLRPGVTVLSGTVEVVEAESGIVGDLLISDVVVGEDDTSLVARISGGTAENRRDVYLWETTYVLKASFTLSSGGAPHVRQCLLHTYNSSET